MWHRVELWIWTRVFNATFSKISVYIVVVNCIGEENRSSQI